jgi:hypothetical protein
LGGSAKSFRQNKSEFLAWSTPQNRWPTFPGALVETTFCRRQSFSTEDRKPSWGSISPSPGPTNPNFWGNWRGSGWFCIVGSPCGTTPCPWGSHGCWFLTPEKRLE